MYRVPCGQDFTIQILKGAYAGEYYFEKTGWKLVK